MLKLTKEIIKDIRSARSIVVRRDRLGNGCMELIIQGKVAGKEVEIRKSWLVDVSLRSYESRDYDTQTVYFEPDPQESACCEVVSIYETGHVGYIVSTLKVDDQIDWCFVGNAGNSHTSSKGIHDDMLQLRLRRANKYFDIEIANSTNPGNSARMIGRFNSSFLINKNDYDYENREEKPIETDAYSLA